MEFMISTFADDIVWLGSGEQQKAEGKEAVAAVFRSGKDGMIACDMCEEQYHSIDLGGGSYLCEAVSRLISKPESETCLNIQQRATFIFREKGDGLETVHIHNSVPFSEIQDDELFPVESGRQAFERLKSALDTKNRNTNIRPDFWNSSTIRFPVVFSSFPPIPPVPSSRSIPWYGDFTDTPRSRSTARRSGTRSKRLTHRTRSGSPRFSTASP